MAAEGLKKKDIQRGVQRVHAGTTTASITMDASNTSDRIEMGFPAEKASIVCTGTLAASVQPMIGNANSNAAISATTTPSTTTMSHLTSSFVITRTSGTGKVIILAK